MVINWWERRRRVVGGESMSGMEMAWAVFRAVPWVVWTVLAVGAKQGTGEVKR